MGRFLRGAITCLALSLDMHFLTNVTVALNCTIKKIVGGLNQPTVAAFALGREEIDIVKAGTMGAPATA